MRTVYEEYYKIHGCAKDCCPGSCQESACQKNKEDCQELKENLCYEISDCNECILENTGLAQAYIPFQESFEIMTPCCALMHGTAFPCLVQPYKKDVNRWQKEGC